MSVIMYKRVVVVVFTFVLCLFAIAPACARDAIQSVQFTNTEKIFIVEADNGRLMKISVSNEAIRDTTEQDILGLAEQYQHDPTIVSIGILSVECAGDRVNEIFHVNTAGEIQGPPQGMSSKAYSMRGSAKEAHEDLDKFIISCAKGESVMRTKSWTGKIQWALEGIILGKAKLDIKGEISYTKTGGPEFHGPPEDSAANSREYRVKFYRYHGTWEQWRQHPYGSVDGTRTGSSKEPARRAYYIIDRIIR